jgi:hypothetical protein
MYRPEEQKQIWTPEALLRGIGDTPENRILTLEAYFPSDPNDPDFENPEFKRFLKDSCDKDPAFLSKLMRLMSASMWPAKAREAYLTALEITDPQVKGSAADETSAPAIVWQTARDLQHEALPPLRWCVPGLLPEGAAMLAGRPKKGKSLLALNMAVGIACGGKVLGLYDVEQGDVAYLALEDGKRRVKNRIESLMPAETLWPDRLSLTYAAPRIDQGLIDNLIAWIKKAENPSLIIVDILAKIRPSRRNNSDIYQQDYDLIAKFMEVAQAHGITILLVTHTSKRAGEDVFDSIMGTSGITGGSATNMVLQRLSDDSPLDGILHVECKDAEDQSIGLKFKEGTWYAEGEAELFLQSTERMEIFETLYTNTRKGLTPKELAEELDKKGGTIRKMLHTLCEQAFVRVDKGSYYLTDKGADVVKAERKKQEVEHNELDSPPAPPSSGALLPDNSLDSFDDHSNPDSPDTCPAVEVATEARSHENVYVSGNSGNTGNSGNSGNGSNTYPQSPPDAASLGTATALPALPALPVLPLLLVDDTKTPMAETTNDLIPDASVHTSDHRFLEPALPQDDQHDTTVIPVVARDTQSSRVDDGPDPGQSQGDQRCPECGTPMDATDTQVAQWQCPQCRGMLWTE